MKQLLLLCLVLCCGGQLYALNANYRTAVFHGTPADYFELYLQVDGRTVNFVRNPTDTTQLNAAVQVSITVRQDSQIVIFDRYVLNSPTMDRPGSFVDQRRYALPAGSYELELTLIDERMTDNSWTDRRSLVLDFPPDKVSQSSIQLLNRHRAATTTDAPSYVKQGRFAEGMATAFISRRRSQLAFYNEVYGADLTDGKLLEITYYLEDRSRKDRPVRYQERTRKQRVKPVVPLLYGMDVTAVPSGNYTLVVEVRAATGELLSSRSLVVQRSNPLFDQLEQPGDSTAQVAGFFDGLDSLQLRFSLKALAPLLEDAEGDYIDALINSKRVAAQRIYLESFWLKESPANPRLAYEQYDEVARSVDATYNNGFGYGFETDRGYLFMRYGKPDDIIREENDPNAPPYEMWVYYDFPKTNQSNVKFVFYNPTLAKNGFTLLHSTARGLLSNPQWEVQLYSQSPGEIQGNNFIDATRMQDNMLRNARENFENL